MKYNPISHSSYPEQRSKKSHFAGLFGSSFVNSHRFQINGYIVAMKAKNNFFKCRLSALQIFVDYRACALFSSRDGTVMAFKAFRLACFRPSIVDNKSPNPFPLLCCFKDLDYTPAYYRIAPSQHLYFQWPQYPHIL